MKSFISSSSPDINPMETITEAIDILNKEIEETGDSEGLNCVDRTVALYDKIYENLIPETLSQEMKLDLGFIFELTPDDTRTKVMFHASNFILVSLLEGDNEPRLIEADAYFGDIRIVGGDVYEHLVGTEDRSRAVIYQQKDYEKGLTSIANSEAPRPAPFTLVRFATRHIWLGEQTGLDAIMEFDDYRSEVRPIDKNKVPVLLVD